MSSQSIHNKVLILNAKVDRWVIAGIAQLLGCSIFLEKLVIDMTSSSISEVGLVPPLFSNTSFLNWNILRLVEIGMLAARDILILSAINCAMEIFSPFIKYNIRNDCFYF